MNEQTLKDFEAWAASISDDETTGRDLVDWETEK